MTWKTYLILHFGTQGAKPTELAKKLSEIGFNAEFGAIDFIYSWGEEKPSKEQVLELADKVAETLSGSGSVFNIDTNLDSNNK
jgi:hypothetical protein